MKNSFFSLFIVLFILSCGTDNKPTYKITTTVSPTEGGTITLNPPGGVYSEGETVTITGTPTSNGWRFVRWEGDWVGTVSPVNIGVSKNYSIVGIFEKKDYPLTVNIQGSGEVQERVIPQRTTQYPYQTVVELTPIPVNGWRFVEWSGDLTGTDAPKQITVDREKTVTAKFERKNYPLTITIVGEGTVKETVLPQKTTEYPYETVVVLEPLPSEGWEFVSWSGDVSGNTVPQMIVVNDAKDVTATFRLKTYPVGVTVQGSGTITVDPQQEVYAHFSTITLTPNPAEGWEFIEWSGGAEGNTVPLEVTVNNALNIIGVFGRKDYPLTVNVIGEGSVTERVIPQRTTQYPFETIVELTSRPVDGWVFYRWTGDLTGNENPKNIQVTNPKSVTSEFKTIDELLTLNIVGEGTVQIQQESFANNPSRRRLTLTPVPSQGWVFVEWTGVLTGTQIPSQLILDGEKVVTATFRQPDPPTVSTGLISNITTNSVTVAGNVSADGGSEVTSRGICYATTPIPTLDNSCINSGSGTGRFTVNITGLTENTKYYVRAFATGMGGTSYGNQAEFTTLERTRRDTVTEVVDVYNPITGRTWMDRNLGAGRVATSSYDYSAFGHLYQWGRGADGHQIRNSPTTTTLSVSNSPTNGNFIISGVEPFDWLANQNNQLWQGLNGVNNPCPVGYRIPSEAEWMQEVQTWSSNNANGAFASVLKLPHTGARSGTNGVLFNDVGVGSHTWYWTNDTNGLMSRFMTVNGSGGPVHFGEYRRHEAYGVRCIKD
jgi:uncharacterized protein (TIGR02145 family)